MGGTPSTPIGGGGIAGKGVFEEEKVLEWAVCYVAGDHLKVVLEPVG